MTTDAFSVIELLRAKRIADLTPLQRAKLIHRIDLILEADERARLREATADVEDKIREALQ